MKKLEKLKKFQLKKEKFGTITGGVIATGGVAATGGGEMCWNGQCLSYSSDYDHGGGAMSWYNVNAVEKEC